MCITCLILEKAYLPIKYFFLKIFVEQQIGIWIFIYKVREILFFFRYYRVFKLFIFNIIPVHLAEEFMIFYLTGAAFYSKTFLRVFVRQPEQKVCKVFAELFFNW